MLQEVSQSALVVVLLDGTYALGDVELGTILGPVVVTDVIRQSVARRWYYMPAAFQEAPERGNYWFDRMKAQYRDQILKGAQKVAGNG